MLQLTQEAFALLQSEISASRRIDGAILRIYFSRIQTELLCHNWLVCTGAPIDVIATADEDIPFADLEWDAECRQYRYFDSTGWNYVDNDDLKAYGINIAQWFEFLQQKLGISQRYVPTETKSDRMWYLGEMRIDHHRLHVFYTNPIISREDRQLCLQACQQILADQVPAIILMPGREVPNDIELPLDVVFVPMEMVRLTNTQSVEFDHQRIAAQLKLQPQEAKCTASVVPRFSTDYRLAYWKGERYKLTKKQAAVIEKLDEQGGRAHKDVLSAAANSNEAVHRIMRNKVNGKWVQHPLWNTLIQLDGGGYYRFVL